MSKKTNVKPIMYILAVLVLGAAGFGYFHQTSRLGDDAKESEGANAASIDAELLSPKPKDILLGDANAVVTIVEYSSLSCPHCGHFHQDVLPALEKEFITPGKVKLVVRHFPLNEPALKASLLVECAGKNGLKRENFMKVLFSMQKQWALSEDFMNNIKQIAVVGGLDSATFASCMEDKDLETSILAERQEAETKLHVSSTPSFFINGTAYKGELNIEGFREAIEKSGGGK